MLKYFAAVLLVQCITIALFFAISRTDLDNTQLVLSIGLLELLFSVLAAFWFAATARQRYQQQLETVKDAHAREREKIRVNAERQKTKIVKDSQQQILKESRRARAGANFKVGATFAGALAFGALMLYTQFVTFGLLVLTTAASGLAGYLARGKQAALARKRELAAQQRLQSGQGKPPARLQ